MDKSAAAVLVAACLFGGHVRAADPVPTTSNRGLVGAACCMHRAPAAKAAMLHCRLTLCGLAGWHYDVGAQPQVRAGRVHVARAAAVYRIGCNKTG